MQPLDGVQLKAQESVLEGDGLPGDVRDTVQHEVLLYLVVVEDPVIKEIFVLDAMAAWGIWLAWKVWSEDLASSYFKVFNLGERVLHF